MSTDGASAPPPALPPPASTRATDTWGGLRADVFGAAAREHQLTRFILLRALGFVYFVAFLVVVNQWSPLLGEHGLLPTRAFFDRVSAALGPSQALLELPSLLWLDTSDAFALGLGWLGLSLSLAVVAGFANAAVMFALWVLYGAFTHAGQIFYGYGWELLLLEAGFLAIFLAPAWRLSPFALELPPLPVLWLYRWLAFRVMFGAGLIKLRGDACWTDLTCMLYHYETQPNPHPLSWLLHQAPAGFHKLEGALTLLVELVVPGGLLAPGRVRNWAAAFTVFFQGTLILSGNLSFLNWLTIAVALAAFDDAWLGRCLPRRLVQRLKAGAAAPPGRARRVTLLALCALIGLLSLNPVMNMLNARQSMNAAFDPLHLVNSYGAFGSVGRVRHEVVLEGSDDEPAASARWRAYEFPCKPTDTLRAPCWITPYHYRLDWQMWFAALGDYRRQPWLLHLCHKLLAGDKAALSFFVNRPFGEAAPKYIRARLYRYEFTRWGEPGWWKRELVGDYLPVLSKDDPNLSRFLSSQGWGP